MWPADREADVRPAATGEGCLRRGGCRRGRALGRRRGLGSRGVGPRRRRPEPGDGGHPRARLGRRPVAGLRPGWTGGSPRDRALPADRARSGEGAAAAAGTAPFHDLNVVLYDGPRPDPGQVLATTTRQLPPKGAVQYVPLPVGSTHWLLAVSSPHPLAGTVAASGPWVALAVGVIGSVLVASVLEQVVRRRDAAVALYRSEHRVAETLQYKLLPTLFATPGLDVASRYVAASDGQQVGGDWFDVFDLGRGDTAVVIGDVMGHDIEAAAAMAQVRAGLRAYAWEGGEPADVVDRLARMVDAFSVTGLVTVVYGVLGAPDDDGGRRFRWANAGHLPPLVQGPTAKSTSCGTAALGSSARPWTAPGPGPTGPSGRLHPGPLH